MITLAEVESIGLQFSLWKLAALEQFVRPMRRVRMNGGGHSALDLPPLDLGNTCVQLPAVAGPS